MIQPRGYLDIGILAEMRKMGISTVGFAQDPAQAYPYKPTIVRRRIKPPSPVYPNGLGLGGLGLGNGQKTWLYIAIAFVGLLAILGLFRRG